MVVREYESFPGNLGSEICAAALRNTRGLRSLFSPRPGFSSIPKSTDHTQQLLLYNGASNKEWKMSQYTINNSTNFSNNNNSFNVQNNYGVVDERSQLLAWLSPLEPGLRHQDIRERRVENVGEWLIQTEEFRSWRDRSGKPEGGSAVLFFYGAPGIGKTFIR